MLGACFNIKLSPRLQHDPKLFNNQGMTVAMYFAMSDKDVPPEWQHPLEMCNELKYTVYDFYKSHGRSLENIDACWKISYVSMMCT